MSDTVTLKHYVCQSARRFSVLWPPDAPRYRVTFGPKHNYKDESELGWWCSCPNNEHVRNQRFRNAGKLPTHKGHPEWDPKWCKHIAQVRQIWCGWDSARDGGAPVSVGGALYCPRCGLPVVAVGEGEAAHG